MQAELPFETGLAEGHSSHARWVALASAIGLVTACLAIAAVVMHLTGRTTEGTDWWIDNVTMALALGIPGVILAIRLPNHPAGWLLLCGALGDALTGFGREYLIFAYDHGLPARAWIAWFSTWAFMPGFGSLPLTLLFFPDGHLPGRRWRAVIAILGVSLVLSVLCGALAPGRLDPTMPGSENPLGCDNPLVYIAGGAGMILVILGILLAIASVVVRYRRSVGDVRQQIRLVGFAGAITSIELIAELMPGYSWGPVLGFVATAGIGAAFVVALLRYRLADVDRFIARTIVYGLMVGALVVVYVVTVVALGTVLQRLGATVVAAALIAVVFAPLREWAQRQVDRLLFGSRRDPYATLSELGARLDPGRQAEAESVLGAVAAAVANAVRAPYAAIVLPGEETPAATSGIETHPAMAIPLTFHGLDRGQLLVAPGPGRRFSAADERFLADLARQAAAAAHAVLLGRDLQHSREAIISTREEERRRLRRDLHDGLGPTLAAIGLRLEGTRVLIGRDPERAREVIGELKDDVRTTLDDLRRLVYALRPPSLDELGLVSAIREQANSFGTGVGADGLVVDVEAPESMPGLPAAVEAAAYRIVTEAMTNVSRHAEARHCRVRLWLSDALEIEVADDGRGPGESLRQGVGLQSMAERAAELGGSCEMRARDGGGAVVRATLPLRQVTP